MAFPIIQFKATNTELSEQLQEVLTRKLGQFEHFINPDGDVKCEVEFEKVAAKNKGDVHRVEVNLFNDGQLFRAEATEESFEQAIDEVRDELDKELRRAHKKRETLAKQGGRQIKDMMRFGE